LTRRALVEAAIKRFADSGVPGTTVAEIAADAGVTERTFYRYFASKEEVLFADYHDRIEWFRRALEVRPPDESITRSVLHAVDAFPLDHRIVSEAARLRSSELTEEQVAIHVQRVQALLGAEIERRLRATICPDPDDELRAAVASGMIAAAVFAALATWGRRGAADLEQLRPLVEEAIGGAEFGVARLLGRPSASSPNCVGEGDDRRHQSRSVGGW
jgi:AcrR family transcriptional regulator